jgi:hypothetical protein
VWFRPETFLALVNAHNCPIVVEMINEKYVYALIANTFTGALYAPTLTLSTEEILGINIVRIEVIPTIKDAIVVHKKVFYVNHWCIINLTDCTYLISCTLNTLGLAILTNLRNIRILSFWASSSTHFIV